MTTEQSRRAGRVAGLTGAFAGLMVGLFGGATPDRAAGAAPNAQPKYEKKEFPVPPAGQKAELVGAAVCQGCHSDSEPTVNPLYKETRGFDFVRLRENKVWSVHDLHCTAYKNLLTNLAPEVKDGSNKANPTAQRMEDNLRRFKGDKYNVWSDTACLACHSSRNKSFADEPPEKWTVDSFLVSDGVGCEMCHGHGTLYKEKHQDSRRVKTGAPPNAVRIVDWREWPPAEKKKWGLVNLRDHAEATAQCASCHIGNTNEGRFVTHDMYAAGHPPLPPLDLSAYTREQPRHWGLPSEMPYLKSLVQKDEKTAAAVFNIRAGESHVARRFAESTIATLHASAALGGQLADAGKEEGLDYAAFDCASCHHNLKYPSDRQDRGYLGKPGRPLYRPAAFALTKLVIEHASMMEGGADLKKSLTDLLAAEKALAVAFTNRSLGDPVKVKAATDALMAWSDGTLKKLAGVKYTPEETKKLLAAVIAETQKPIADPEIAQLYTWAFETLVLALTPEAADKKPPEVITELQGKLKDIVVTRLRPRVEFYYEADGGIGVRGPTDEPVDSRIGPRMVIFNSFQDAPFKKAFQEAKLFPKP